MFYAGQSLIELAGHGAPTTPGGPFPGALWLQVRDIYATQDELRGRGVEVTREARQEPWGLHEMHVTDPDGVTLIFVQIPADHPCGGTRAAERGRSPGLHPPSRHRSFARLVFPGDCVAGIRPHECHRG